MAAAEAPMQGEEKLVPAPRRSRNYTSLNDLWDGTLRNPDNLRVTDYQRMRDTDETIAAALEFISLSVCHYLGEYHHPRKRIQKFVRENLDEMRTSIFEVVDGILDALAVGFSVTETVLGERDGKICIDEWVTLRPETVRFELERDHGSRQHGQVTVAHQRYLESDWVKLHTGQFLHYAHNGKYSNPYGRSRLKSIWKNWFLKDVLLKAWGMTLERYGSPIAIGKTSGAGNKVNLDGVEMSRSEYLLQVLENLQNSSVLVINSDEEVLLEQVQRAFGADFQAAQQHLNLMEFRGLLTPSLVFDTGDGVGSYAMANKHFEVYVRGVLRIVRDVSRVLIRQGIRPLIRLNFGPQRDGYGEFQAQTLEEEDLKMWSEIFFAMTKVGILNTQKLDDLNWMRAKLGREATDEVPKAQPEADPAGRDGMPDQAPDGQDDQEGAPAPSPRAPGKPQGRPTEEDEE